MPRVHRVTAAVDCGEVCHPDNATAQVEGAIVMGFSAAIGEEITIAAAPSSRTTSLPTRS